MINQVESCLNYKTNWNVIISVLTMISNLLLPDPENIARLTTPPNHESFMKGLTRTLFSYKYLHLKDSLP